MEYKEAKKKARRVASEARGCAYYVLHERLGTKEARRTYTRWQKFAKRRQGTSTKLNASRTRLIDF
jgi:hypothetical protein